MNDLTTFMNFTDIASGAQPGSEEPAAVKHKPDYSGKSAHKSAGWLFDLSLIFPPCTFQIASGPIYHFYLEGVS